MEKLLTKLTTVAKDTSKHIVGASYANWIVLVLTGFFGATVGFYASLTVCIIFVLWELYFKIFDKRPISVKDILAGLFVVAIPLSYLYQLK